MNSTRTLLLLAGIGIAAIQLHAITPQTASAEPTRTDAEKDPVLKAMLEELDRSRNELQLKDFTKPFFIEYRIEDIESYATKAEFGATEGAQRSHRRMARVTVRVGDYKSDSSGERNDGSLELTTLDDDPIALRSTLWTATDQAYKNALAAYAHKQAELKEVQTSPQADDFSHEKRLISLAEPLQLKLDQQAWVERVSHVSGLYRSDASVKESQQNIEYSEAEFQARVTTIWLVNSEGTIVRKTSSEYGENFGVSTQADDGMRLDRREVSTGPSLGDLDPPDVFEKHALALITSLDDLRKAPVVEEEYYGPVLLSANASVRVIHALMAGGLTATRPKLGTEARTNGPFASSYHAHVLPDFLNVIDDPGLKSYNGKGLLGAYDVDDEGVPAQAVKLITEGQLENYLIGREPVRDLPNSNGHARAGVAGVARPVIGVLQLSAKDGLTDEDLNQKMLAMANERGLKNVYFVETLGGEKLPTLLYRVGLDGKRQLVRGAALDDLDQRALRSSIEAAGKDLRMANDFGDVPETVLAPALLFGDLTIRRANKTNDKLPFYPPPE